MVLRPASLDDAEKLASFARDAFDDAFGHLYKPRDLQAFFDEWRTTAVYKQLLGRKDAAVQLAMSDDEIAAYCVLTRGFLFDEHPEPRPEKPAFVSQLYCSSKTTGKGNGAALMDWAIAQAGQWQCDAITLSVFSENFGAQRFYQRYGFRHLADIDFWVGDHRDDEFLYSLTL